MMQRLLFLSAMTLCVAVTGCEQKDSAPTAAAPKQEPAKVQGAAIDGSSDVKGKPIDAPPAAVPAPAPGSAATAGAKKDEAAKAAPMVDANGKPVTAEDLKKATPMAAPGADATGQEHESYQALLAARAQTMDKPSKEIPGYTGVAFADLTSFGYMPKAPSRAEALKTKLETETPLEEDNQIPTAIKQLDGKKIALQGYMIPVDFEAGGTNDFLLVQVVPSCYFCQQPQPNEWVEVKTKDGKRIPYNGDDPLIITGVMDVGAKYKGGYFLSLYRMEADASHEP